MFECLLLLAGKASSASVDYASLSFAFLEKDGRDPIQSFSTPVIIELLLPLPWARKQVISGFLAQGSGRSFSITTGVRILWSWPHPVRGRGIEFPHL